MFHWCEFCQTNHSSKSCYHPGRQTLADVKAKLDAANHTIYDLATKNERLRGALALAKSMILSGEDMSLDARAAIDSVLKK